MDKIVLKPEEVKLLLDFIQNATISNINGNGMWAIASIMSKMGAFIQTNDNAVVKDEDNAPEPSGY